MTVKFDEFEKALEELCESHGVQISASAYDSIQVWDLEDGDEFIYSGLEDRTKDDG